MPQIKKNAKIVTMKLDLDVYTKLDDFCQETGLSRTVAVEKILDKQLTEYFKLPQKDRTII